MSTNTPYSMGSRKSLGQHFLTDKTVINQIIQAAELTQDDIVVEIGPGKGILTKHSFKIEKYLSKTPHKNTDISGLKILNVSATSDNFTSLIEINAESQSPLINPKFYLGNDLGLPIITPQYNFSVDRKYITAQFYYK